MLKVATAHNLYKIIVDINMCADLQLLKVKVPL